MPLILAFHRLVGGWNFRRDRRESPQFLQVYFAAVRDSLDVATPGNCSSKKYGAEFHQRDLSSVFMTR